MGRPSLERRRRFVIDQPFQGKLVLNIALFPALALGIIALITGVWCGRVLEDAVVLDSEVPDLMPLVYTVIGFEVLAGIFLLVNSVKVSHRIAGPAYRLCKSLQRIRSGDLAFVVTLRQDDHLTEIRDELNLLLDWLNEHPPAGALTRQLVAAAAAPPDAPAEAAEPAASATAADRAAARTASSTAS